MYSSFPSLIVCDTGSILFHAAGVLVTFAGPVDCRSVELIFAVQEVKDMSVRKATLLEFDGIDTRHMSTKDVVTAELLQHFLESKIKDSSNQVWAITPGLYPHTTFICQ